MGEVQGPGEPVRCGCVCACNHFPLAPGERVIVQHFAGPTVHVHNPVDPVQQTEEAAELARAYAGVGASIPSTPSESMKESLKRIADALQPTSSLSPVEDAITCLVDRLQLDEAALRQHIQANGRTNRGRRRS